MLNKWRLLSEIRHLSVLWCFDSEVWSFHEFGNLRYFFFNFMFINQSVWGLKEFGFDMGDSGWWWAARLTEISPWDCLLVNHCRNGSQAWVPAWRFRPWVHSTFLILPWVVFPNGPISQHSVNTSKLISVFVSQAYGEGSWCRSGRYVQS